jgi:peptide-methionine (S)-S-oxide reductase
VRLPHLSVSLLAALLWPAAPSTSPQPTATAVFAGGCFWGVESVFEHLRGVRSAVSGFAGGQIEAVRVVYDPHQVSYGELLEVFFHVAHDPTQRDRQGPDVGPEYRAVVFYDTAEEQRVAESYVAQLERARSFPGPIVTEVRRVDAFRIAESFHQDYAARHPEDPYIVVNDAPKLILLQRAFPKLFRAHAEASSRASP